MDALIAIVLLIIGFIVISYLYIKNMKKYQDNYSNYYKVNIVINGSEYKLNGYLERGEFDESVTYFNC